jgi:hypothetical protein
MIRIPARSGMVGNAPMGCPDAPNGEPQVPGIDYDAPARPGKDIVEQRMACMRDGCQDWDNKAGRISVRHAGQYWCMKEADILAGKTPCESDVAGYNKACVDHGPRNLAIGAGVVAAAVALLIWRPWR